MFHSVEIKGQPQELTGNKVLCCALQMPGSLASELLGTILSQPSNLPWDHWEYRNV